MNSFATLVADFAEKTGVELGKPGPDSIDVEADGVVVSAQYRADREDCVIFTLPLEDAEPDAPMLRRAMELAANGDGNAGHADQGGRERASRADDARDVGVGDEGLGGAPKGL